MKYNLIVIMLGILILFSMPSFAYDPNLNFIDDDMMVSDEIIIKDMIVREDYVYQPFSVCDTTSEDGRRYIQNYSYDECTSTYNIDNQDNFTIEKHAIIDLFANKDIKYHCVGYAYEKELNDDISNSNLMIRELPKTGELLVSGQPKLDYELTTLEGETEYINVACFESDYNSHTFYFNLTTTFNKSDDSLGYNEYNQPNALEDINVFLGHIDYQNYHKYLTNKYNEELETKYGSATSLFGVSIILVLVYAVFYAIMLGITLLVEGGDKI